MKVDIESLRALLTLLEERDVSEFEHEADGVRVHLVRGAKLVAQAPVPIPAAPAANTAKPAIATEAALPDDVVDITSPFVGTFYRSPSPDAPSFVEVGSVVRQGQPMCIVEAMKLMNEIESEFAGTVVEIFVANGKSVEYGQKLFRIKKA
jgi:acetyl-CoA carboxylase biotin carboxyl carrier protein